MLEKVALGRANISKDSCNLLHYFFEQICNKVMHFRIAPRVKPLAFQWAHYQVTHQVGESCVLLKGPYTKTQLSDQCQVEVFTNLMCHLVGCPLKSKRFHFRRDAELQSFVADLLKKGNAIGCVNLLRYLRSLVQPFRALLS